ncbi:MAG: transposase [Actinomycetota bacterium]
MARRPRPDQAGAHLLVTNRGTAQTAIFRTNADRWFFLQLLGDLRHHHGVAVLAYVLMGNHYHLVVRLDRSDLSGAMQNVDGTHARRFNAVHGRQGALFQGRYDARPLDDDASLQGAGAYVHLNPFRAGLVTTPHGYRWSSLSAYCDRTATHPWLRLDLLEDRTAEEYRAFIDFEALGGLGVLKPATDDHAVFVRWDTDRRVAEAFKANDHHVAGRFGVSVDALYVVNRGRRNPARMAAIVSAFRGMRLPAALVAERYGLHRRSAVYAVEQRFASLAAFDPRVAVTLDEIAAASDDAA